MLSVGCDLLQVGSVTYMPFLPPQAHALASTPQPVGAQNFWRFHPHPPR